MDQIVQVLALVSITRHYSGICVKSLTSQMIKMSKKAILAGSSSHIPLMDTEVDIFDPVFSINYI